MKPVIFLAFANSSEDYLSSLLEEGDQIQSKLYPLQNEGKIQVFSKNQVNIDSLFAEFTKYRDQIVIFHFGGHADGENLYFGEKGASSQGLAKLLAAQKNLELVFFEWLLYQTTSGGLAQFGSQKHHCHLQPH